MNILDYHYGFCDAAGFDHRAACFPVILTKRYRTDLRIGAPSIPGQSSNGPQLCLDIFENVIDMCGEGSHCALLAACALVSSDCLPRARANLYRHLRLTCYQDCILLLETLRSHPSLANHTQGLIIDPTSEDSAFIPYILLSPFIPSLHTLTLGVNTTWKAYPPLYTYIVGAQFTQVTRVTLLNHRTHIYTTTLFRFVWSFPNLQELIIRPGGRWVREKSIQPWHTDGIKKLVNGLSLSTSSRHRDFWPRLTSLCLPVSTSSDKHRNVIVDLTCTDP